MEMLRQAIHAQSLNWSGQFYQKRVLGGGERALRFRYR